MGQTWEGESHSIKWVTLIKIVALGSTSHTVSKMGLGSTFGQMGQTWEGESHSINGSNGSHLSKLSHLEVGVTLGKMGHIWPNGSNLGR